MRKSLRLILTADEGAKRPSQTARTTAESTARPDLLIDRVPQREPPPESVEKQIRDKYKTFARFDARSYLISRKKVEKKNESPRKDSTAAPDLNFMKYVVNFANEMKKKEEREKRNSFVEEDAPILENVIADRRERFKRSKNPLEFIRYYSKKNQIQETIGKKETQQKIVELKALIESMENFQLEPVLNEIYELMALTVDHNDLKLLVLTILMAAEICAHAKDLQRAVYFFEQAKIAADYAKMPEIKIDAFIGMGKIALQITQYESSLIFLKKALGYAWLLKDVESELMIFDHIGHTYWQMGCMELASYYHLRYSQSEPERDTSAIKKIYLEIIKDSEKGKMLDIFGDNVDLLFMSTLSLPIMDFRRYSPSQHGQIYENYVEGASPRKMINSAALTLQHIKSPEEQFAKILSEDAEFRTEMPDPDTQQCFAPSRRYGKERKEVEFSRTVEFHRITKGKTVMFSPFSHNAYFSTEKKIKMEMDRKMDPEWYEKMVKKVKMERSQKLGTLKDQIQKSHLKVRERKRSLSNQSEQIKYTVNKAILNWVDPSH